jgi:hypothetical protein
MAGMSGSKDELRAIEDALIESIMGASPEETVTELRGQGIDPDEGVILLDRMAAEALAAVKRQQLDAAKARVSAFKAIQGGRSDPSARQGARAKLAELRSGTNGSPMMLAARKGTGMSERDEESLADDLAELERLRRDDGET